MQQPAPPAGDTRKLSPRRILTAIKKSAPYFAGALTVLAGVAFYNFLRPPAPPVTEKEMRATIEAVMASATPRAAFSADVYDTIRFSLVLIQAEGKDKQEEDTHSLGSGVVISDFGAILTSLHVVSGAERIEVVFADGTKSAASVAEEQPENDIAVLLPETLPSVVVPAVMGNPFAMRVGDEAYAVGNPFGLYSSLSAGVISGFDRTFKAPGSDVEIEGMIQIDTAVNPGNSGGPLLNRYGEVVGIVTGIANPTQQEVFIGIGFAVPITAAGGAAGAPPY